ncbi:MAG: hypothetical protein GXP47_04450 [Acidobacteria bacterium]|nr:hypothetical protein [Acidobacteriota bacterium]
MTEGQNPGLLDGVRRWFHRRERSLIVWWLALLVVLNLLPVGWLVANRAWGIEDKLVRGYRWYWHQRYLSALAAERQDPARGLRSFEALLADLGPAQLRETTGRLRQDALLQVAALELEAGHPKRSMRVAHRVTATDPYDVRGWVALGDALWARRKKGDAVAAYERALEMNPNLEHAVGRVMEHQADHADWEGVIATFERYRNAVWSLPAYLQFTGSWPHFDVEHRIQIPILADGRRHTWRLHPAHPRAVGSFVFRTMGPIAGLALTTAAPGVVVELHALRFFPAANRFTSPPAPIVEIDGFRGWKAGRDLVSLGPNRWLVGRGDAMLRAPISIPQPGKVARIELDMTVSKPVRPELEHLLHWACHNLGRDDEVENLLAGMAVLPEPAPPGRRSARTGPAAPRATVPAVPRGYSIAVAGHLRRGPEDDPPLLPALIAALPDISLEDRALVLTGDIVWEGTPARWKRFDELVRRPVGIPLFIAPGNHDLFDGRAGAARKRFVTLFGPTWKRTRIGGSLLLVLDTEESPGDISTGQLEMALAAVDQAGRDPEVSSVLVFLHRVLWFLGDPRYSGVAGRANRSSQPGQPGNGNGRRFCSVLLPRLKELARTKPVAVIAGDVGTRIPLVYDRRGGVVLIASGNRAQDPPAWWNHYLRVHLAGGRIRVETVSLGSAPLGAVERYTPAFWAAHPGTLRPPLKAGP